MGEYVQVQIERSLFERMQAVSIPLTDTVSSVIARLLDCFESQNPDSQHVTPLASKQPEVVVYDPESPPSLRHAVPDTSRVNGVTLQNSQRYWNNVMIETIREAAQIVDKKEIFDAISVNKVSGERTDTNFNFIKEAGFSIQLQNSDSAWKMIYRIATLAGIAIEVDFRWSDKANVAFRGRKGRLQINGSKTL